jgi:hypothetical protein
MNMGFALAEAVGSRVDNLYIKLKSLTLQNNF